MDDSWTRIYTAVNHLVERLEAKDVDSSSRLYDSVVDNISTLSEMLPGLNITDDPKMAKMGQKIKDKLTKYNADTLKDSPLLRHEIKSSAKEILNDLDGNGHDGEHHQDTVSEQGQGTDSPEQAERGQENNHF